MPLALAPIQPQEQVISQPAQRKWDLQDIDMTKREKKIAQLKARGESPKRVAYIMRLWDAAERRGIIGRDS